MPPRISGGLRWYRVYWFGTISPVSYRRIRKQFAQTFRHRHIYNSLYYMSVLYKLCFKFWFKYISPQLLTYQIDKDASRSRAHNIIVRYLSLLSSNRIVKCLLPELPDAKAGRAGTFRIINSWRTKGCHDLCEHATDNKINTTQQKQRYPDSSVCPVMPLAVCVIWHCAAASDYLVMSASIGPKHLWLTRWF